MITISGRVIFDRNRTATVIPNMQGIPNVSVVLQNIFSGKKLSVLTNGSGNYAFNNVPNGNYRIVESFGTPSVATPGNFNNAIAGPIPHGAMPPLSFVSNPPTTATNLDATTPNTLFISVNCEDENEEKNYDDSYLCLKYKRIENECHSIENVDFLNGPVKYAPISAITDNCVSISNINLISAADNGTFGFFADGTPANTGANPNPYPTIAPDFTYVLPNPDTFTPNAGEYTIQNLMNNSLSNRIGAWWRIADHTKGNETGRMMVVNGFEPGSVFFRDTVEVQPNTNYLFSAWILNMFKVTGFANPALSVEIIDENKNVIFHETLGALIPVNTIVPEWKQIGTVINSENNTSLTVKFLSEGPEDIGNDYAIDDILFSAIEIPVFVPVKTSNKSQVTIGETVTYNVTIHNTCQNPLTDVHFIDIIPNGLSFVPNTVMINGNPSVNDNPNVGFNIPNISANQISVITFEAIADFIPMVNPTLNQAEISYRFTPIDGGIPNNFSANSNAVPVLILNEESRRCNAIADIIESVALQETALSHILNAEGEKIQKALTMQNITAKEIIEINNKAIAIIDGITKFELILQNKLQFLSAKCKNSKRLNDFDIKS